MMQHVPGKSVFKLLTCKFCYDFWRVKVLCSFCSLDHWDFFYWIVILSRAVSCLSLSRQHVLRKKPLVNKTLMKLYKKSVLYCKRLQFSVLKTSLNLFRGSDVDREGFCWFCGVEPYYPLSFIFISLILRKHNSNLSFFLCPLVLPCSQSTQPSEFLRNLFWYQMLWCFFTILVFLWFIWFWT